MAIRGKGPQWRSGLSSEYKNKWGFIAKKYIGGREGGSVDGKLLRGNIKGKVIFAKLT